MNKPRVVKSLNKLPMELIEKIKSEFPYGLDKHLITFSDPKGKLSSAFPYETNEYHYLIRMSRTEARKLYQEDIVIDLEEVQTEKKTKVKRAKSKVA